MSLVSPVSISNEREIKPMDLPIEQLNNLKMQHEEELRELQKQMESLAGKLPQRVHWPQWQKIILLTLVTGAKNRFLMAKSSLNELQSAEDNNALMIPLNASLYVPGSVHDKNKVIVELGTGYFAEKSIEDAHALVDRKVCC